MVRLRDAVLAVALAVGGVGCATFCDECDDFPSPGGPGGFSMMPGSYTGPPLRVSPNAGAGQLTSPSPIQDTTPAPAASLPVPANVDAHGEAAPSPPAPPPAGPGAAAQSRPGAEAVDDGASTPATTVSTSHDDVGSTSLPAAPAETITVPPAGSRNNLPLNP